VADAAEQVDEAAPRGERDRAHRRDRGEAADRVVLLVLDGVDDLLGDLGERLVPGDPLPLPLAALAGPTERVRDALVGVHVVAETRSLLTAPRVRIRERLVESGVVAGLLLAPHLPIPRVHLPRAAARAVDAVRRAGLPVPVPLLAVEVLPVAVRVVADRVVDDLQRGHLGEVLRGAQAGGADGGRHPGPFRKSRRAVPDSSRVDSSDVFVVSVIVSL